MVKRIALLVLPIVCLATPLAAQDYAQLEIGFGYANWGAEAPNSMLTALESHRVSGFAMHTNYNLTTWFAIDNYLGAYSMPEAPIPIQGGFVTLKPTAIYNLFGVKLTARDLLNGAISPFVVAGFGGGSVSEQGYGISSSAARYGGGVDFNLNGGFALRVDASNLAVSKTLYDTSSWSSDFNLATSIIFKLGF